MLLLNFRVVQSGFDYLDVNVFIDDVNEKYINLIEFKLILKKKNFLLFIQKKSLIESLLPNTTQTPTFSPTSTTPTIRRSRTPQVRRLQSATRTPRNVSVPETPIVRQRLMSMGDRAHRLNQTRTQLAMDGQNEYVGRNDFFYWQAEPDYSRGPDFIPNFSAILPNDIKEIKQKHKFFDIIMDDFILEKIVSSTNLRIKDKGYDEEKYVTLLEIKAFIGLLLLFGVLGKNAVQISEIWCDESDHHSDRATATMCRDQFQFIAQNITFHDSQDIEPFDLDRKNYFKIGKVFDHFKNNIKKCKDSFIFLKL